MNHIEGQSRHQSTLFPQTLDDLIPLDHPVRVVDAFVDSLDLGALEFGKVQPAATGRPPYHPGDMLKLYVYGYLNQLRSSRRLERESGRNVELLWLLNRLSPDFKTIANFRKDNRKAIVGVCRAFVHFCREQELFSAELVSIDGSKFRAVASRKAVYTPKRIEPELARIDQRVNTYMTEMDGADINEPEMSSGEPQTTSALALLQQRRGELQTLASNMTTQGTRQQVVTKPEARLMRQSGGGHAVSYNVQTAADAKHKLIVSHAVTQDGNDLNQLFPMASMAQEALGVERLTVVADAGYQNGKQGAECAALGITAVVPGKKMVNPQGDYFDKSQFTYEQAQEQYRCPAGEVLTVYKTDKKIRTRYYSTGACETCLLRPQCTRSRRRTLNRHFDAGELEAMNRRAIEQPEIMQERMCLSEHPFGTMKYQMGNSRFMVRGLKNVKGEMASTVLGYNLMRVINIMGVPTLCARLTAT
ncbi:MAG: IS1182 family transposase [Gammaproteobacteria bacterium]